VYKTLDAVSQSVTYSGGGHSHKHTSNIRRPENGRRQKSTLHYIKQRMRLIFREESGKNGVWYGTDEKLSVIDYYVSYHTLDMSVAPPRTAA